MSSEQEAQKVIDDLQKRIEDFQAGKMYTSEKSNFFSSGSNRKLILTIVSVAIALALSVFVYVKSVSGKIKTKIPDGYEIIYPPNEPPRLQLKS
jgi:hypothetical protein